MTEHDEQPLQPAAFTPKSTAKIEAAPTASAPKYLLLAIGVLLIMLLLVLFALPRWVSPVTPIANIATTPEGAITAEPANNSVAQGTVNTAKAAASPFADAQRQKERRAAQETLEQVLEVQEALLELSVIDWAPLPYNDAIQQAENGDAAYREGRFKEATAAYQGAFEQLLTLESSIVQRRKKAIATLVTAVEQGDVDTANSALERLRQLATETFVLTPLTERVNAIDTVQEALARADTAVDAQDYDAALGALQRAIDADPVHEQAAKRQAEVVQLDIEFRFREHMSAGYLALEQAAFDKAETAFNDAAALKPGAPEPQAAQQELSDARVAAHLLRLRQRSEELVDKEQWQQAVAVYREALAIDPTLSFAQEGIASAQPRANLDEALRAIVEQKERLTNPVVLAEAESTLDQAIALPNPGPLLSEQIGQARQTLSYAKTPVTVSLVSDGDTDVTVLRVQRLGAFETTSLTLRPGQYTAMGVRTGYRDVRVNFEVVPGADTTVDVRCEEAI